MTDGAKESSRGLLKQSSLAIAPKLSLPQHDTQNSNSNTGLYHQPSMYDGSTGMRAEANELDSPRRSNFSQYQKMTDQRFN